MMNQVTVSLMWPDRGDYFAGKCSFVKAAVVTRAPGDVRSDPSFLSYLGHCPGQASTVLLLPRPGFPRCQASDKSHGTLTEKTENS